MQKAFVQNGLVINSIPRGNASRQGRRRHDNKQTEYKRTSFHLRPMLRRPITVKCTVCGKSISYRYFTSPYDTSSFTYARDAFAYAVRDEGYCAIVTGKGIRNYALDEESWRCLLETLLADDFYLSTHVEMIHNDSGVVFVTLPPTEEARRAESIENLRWVMQHSPRLAWGARYAIDWLRRDNEKEHIA